MRIAVAGAGIAGLTAALAFADKGFAVEIFEKAESLEEIGAGIQLSPNAMRLLQSLGLAEGLRPGLFEPEAIEIRDGLSGRRLNSIPLGETARRRYGAPYALIHRADLQATLYAAARARDGVSIHLQAEVHDIRATDSGVVFHAAGQGFRSDVLVAADGMNSRLRTGYLGNPGPRPLGKTAWRAALPASALPSSISRVVTGLWMGPGGHFVHYPVRGGATLNVVVIAGEPVASGAPPLAPFGKAARQLIDAVPEWTRWPLFENDPVPAWTRGRVALIGDAAHAMAPSAAQGGAQAIEDACELASALAAAPDEPAAALASYERSRRPRVIRVAQEAKNNLAIYNMRGLPATLRNVVISALPAKILLSRLDWIFASAAPPKNG